MRHQVALIVCEPGQVRDELAELARRAGYFCDYSLAAETMAYLYNAEHSVDVLLLTSADASLLETLESARKDLNERSKLLHPPWCRFGVLRMEQAADLVIHDKAIVVADTALQLKNLLDEGSYEAVMRPLALLVEDDETFGESVRYKLWRKGVSVFHARDAETAVKILPTLSNWLDLAIVDLKLQIEDNGGWRVIAELGLLTWPDWCQIAVITAYEATGPAAQALGLKFFLKGQSAGFFNFLDEVLDNASKRRNGETKPVVLVDRGVAEASYDERMACKAISSAEKVVIKGRPKGSLQRGAVVTAQIFPKDGGASYDGVVKCGDASKIGKELCGYRRLSQYFGSVGRFIPPPTPYPSLVTQAEKVVVTPWVRGKTLYEIIQDYWLPDLSDVALMKGVMKDLREFLDGIRTLHPVTHPVDDIFQNEYFDERRPDAKRRLEKAIRVLSRCIVEEPRVLTDKEDGRLLNVDGLLMNNPLWGLEHASELNWKKVREGCSESRYSHGDFHAGNILIDIDPAPPGMKQVFVLDYDYVGSRCKYYDAAQMETSLWMALSMDKCLHTEGGWTEKLRPAILSLVASQNTVKNGGIDNSWVENLAEVVRYWRGEMYVQQRLFYNACLFTTMLRIFTSQYLKENGLQSVCVLSGLTYLGLLLDGLVEPSVGDERTQSLEGL